ncbi:hypothetical protein FSHL1_005226 [Fusarium sambucinum]
MSRHPGSTRRDISNNAFDGGTRIHQGDVHNNVYYSSPHPIPHTGVVRVIPYPRNEDLVHRQDLVKRLDDLLSSTPESCSAALWGLGGSGKTQIALNYAYRRCDTDRECCVFWVHAENEATFSADYKTIGKKLGIDNKLNGTILLDAVRTAIEAKPNWVMIIDNADNLSLFGVEPQVQAAEEIDQQDQNLRGYIPCAPQGTVLWTSRDGHVAGTLVGARRGIEVRSMDMNEARKLLVGILDIPSTAPETTSNPEVDILLKELQYLPLAISQAGGYMKRLSITAREYLGYLKQGKSRWDVLGVSDVDRHRRPEVSNSVLETWKISTEQIRTESIISYHILHVIAYVDNQDIPQELLGAAASSFALDGDSVIQTSELEILQSVARLEEFSFLNLRRTDDGERCYEMHKLVQEALRYNLKIRGSIEMPDSPYDRSRETEAFYSGKALKVVNDLYPTAREPASRAQCEKYVTHAVRIGEWAEMSGTEAQTSYLLERVASFLHHRGRWRETGPVNDRVLILKRGVLGEKHPGTIRAMSNLAIDYSNKGHFDKARGMKEEALELRREVLGDEHPDTIESMLQLGWEYSAQENYDEAEVLQDKALKICCSVLGEKHHTTIRAMGNLGQTYIKQNRLDEAQKAVAKALEIGQEVLGEKHQDNIKTMALLGDTYYLRGQHKEGEEILIKAISLGKEVRGEKHPETVFFIVTLAWHYCLEGRYDDAEPLYQVAVDLFGNVLGDSHPYVLNAMKGLTYVQAKLQQQDSRAESVGFMTMDGIKGGREGFSSLPEVMRRKLGKLRMSRSSRGQGQ